MAERRVPVNSRKIGFRFAKFRFDIFTHVRRRARLPAQAKAPAVTDDAPFAGLKVLDVSQGVATPHCGLLLAEYGADVVKLEPLEGDWSRSIGRGDGTFSPHFVAFNRGKRSIALDLKSDDGRGVAQALAAEADVVLQNYRPGVAERLGLGYERIRETNAGVIYLSLSGFGSTGPHRDRPATDRIMQSMSGLLVANRTEDGNPHPVGIVVVDIAAGMYAFQAVSVALYARAGGRGGRHIELSLMQCAAALQAGAMMDFQAGGGDPPREQFVPVGTFPTRDGMITVSATNERHFAGLCEAVGRPELADDPRYDTNAKRMGCRDELFAHLRDGFRRKTTAQWEADLTARGIINAPVLDYTGFMAHEQVRALGTVRIADHPGMGPLPFAQVPGAAPLPEGGRRLRAPRLGEHSAEILEALGIYGEDIAALKDAGKVRFGGD